MRNLFVFLLLSALASGCAQRVQTQIESYHNFTGSEYAGRSITIPPYSEQTEASRSLEFRAFQVKLADHLRSQGFQIVSPQDGPDYVAFFGYAIDDGQSVTSTYSIPQYGVTGYSGSTTTGTITSLGNMSTLNATTNYTPQYGITGYTTGTSTDVVYTRSLSIGIVEVATEEPVYQMQLASRGSCGALSAVIDELLMAAFADFPGDSASSRQETIKAEGSC